MENENLEKFKDYTERIRVRYINLLAYFIFFDLLRKMTAPNVVGEDTAKQNASFMNQYGSFFKIARNSAENNFLLELSKFFDNQDDALSAKKCINIMKNNLSDSCRHKLDIDNLNNLFGNNENSIKKLKESRDEYLVHDDIKKKNYNTVGALSVGEAEVLLKFVGEIVRVFDNCLNLQTMMFNGIEQQIKDDIKNIMDRIKK